MMALESSHQYIWKLLLQLPLLGLQLYILLQRFIGIDAVLEVVPSEEPIKIHDEGFISDQR